MSDRFSLGRKIRTEVLGAEAVRQRLDQADSFNREFQELITEFCWGASWGRDALSRRDRSLLNIGMLAALNRPQELALHVRAAFRNGVAIEELKDTLIQVAVYCGVPAGVEAFRIATQVIKEVADDVDAGAPPPRSA